LAEKESQYLDETLYFARTQTAYFVKLWDF